MTSTCKVFNKLDNSGHIFILRANESMCTTPCSRWANERSLYRSEFHLSHCKCRIQESNQTTQHAFLFPRFPSLCLWTTTLPHSQNIPIMPCLCRSHYHVSCTGCQIEFVIDFMLLISSVLPPVVINLTAIHTLFTILFLAVVSFSVQVFLG